MRVFIYEHLTAQGAGREPDDPGHGMYLEGRAMRDAVAEDFARVAGVEVFTFPDDGPAVDRYMFADAANGADWAVVIAPESEGTLADLAEEVWPTGSRFLGPSAAAIRRAADKLALAAHWYDNDVPTPETWDRAPSPRDPFPVMWKPQDGAGSTATFRLLSAADATRAKAQRQAENHSGRMILQPFVAGRAASVAFLCGPGGYVPLLPTFQSLSDDGRCKYLGGELPIPGALAARAAALAQRAVDCMPGLLGYVGVDLVLGDAADGSRDFAIEINPRLTTSYVGLRAAADFNLAEAMLQAATGTLKAPFGWKPGTVRFGPDGSVRRH
jgi:predicted ATP-grasp superfamily ATP-dependent carboligase